MITEVKLRQLLKKADTPSKEIEENLSFYRLTTPFFKEALHGDQPDWIIEIGGGRGLAALIWMLLQGIPHAMIVDQRMPDTYVKLIRRMQKLITFEYPDFFVGKLTEYEPPLDERIVVIGVHCCGSLTDELIDFAINYYFPFAVVPCCHAFDDALVVQLAQYLNVKSENSLSNLIDGIRLHNVRMKNYDIKWAQFDRSISPKNNILMGKPQPPRLKQSSLRGPVRSTCSWSQLQTSRGKRHHLNRVLQLIGEGHLAAFDEIGGRLYHHIKFANQQGAYFIIRFMKDPFMMKRMAVLDQFERENAFYDKLRKFDFPIPEFLWIDASGKYLRDVFSVRRWLPGVPLQSIFHTLNVETQGRLLFQLGQMLANIHSIQFESSGLIDAQGKPGTPFWGSHFDKLIEAVKAGLHYLSEQTVLNRHAVIQLKNKILSHEMFIKQQQNTKTLIHGDFQFKNILVAEQGGYWTITGLLEPKFPAAGDPAVDLLKMEDSIYSPHEQIYRSAFYQGYGYQPSADSFQVGLQAYRLAQAPQYVTYFRSFFKY